MFYQYIFVMRPDLSAQHVMEFVATVEAFLAKNKGKVHVADYWGFRTLAYRIGKFGKAHYVCLGIESSCIKELDSHLRYHGDLLRTLCIRMPKGLEGMPSHLRHSSVQDMQNAPVFEQATLESTPTGETL